MTKNESYHFWTTVHGVVGAVADARLHDPRHAHASPSVMNGESLQVARSSFRVRLASTTIRYVHLHNATQGKAAERVAIVLDHRLQ